jgi:glycosyltransferase involved in cell wall biosynthesis
LVKLEKEKIVLISLVIPVYNSSEFIEETVKVIFRDFTGYDFEIILVNDGSPDNSWSVIKQIASTHENITSINLSQNYGQHSAVLCGINNAKGDYLVTLDDDLQNPPKEIHKLITKIQEGYDIVFAVFEQKKHASYRRLGSKLIGYFNAKIFNKPKDITLTNFRIFTKEIANQLSEYKTLYPYIPGLLLLQSRSIANVKTEHHSRKDGKSNYSLVKILKLVSRLLINYSSYPLKILTAIGTLITVISFLFGFITLVNAVLYGNSTPGWASIMIMMSFLNGILILMVGMIGIYVSRTLNQISYNKPYVIKEKVI